MKHFVLIALLMGSLFVIGTTNSLAKNTGMIDSIGVERVGGKLFIIHKVDPGQTMFAVVRKYNVTIHTLRDANPGISDNIQSGQLLRVPYEGKALSKRELKREDIKVVIKTEDAVKKEIEPVKTEAPIVPPSVVTSNIDVAPNGLHKVEAGQTLYRVAVKYGILMADIRKWNNLQDDNLKEGQTLIVSEPGIVKSPQPTQPIAKVVTTVIKDSVRAKAAEPEKIVKPAETPAPPKVITGHKKTEAGLAEVIVTDESTSKFLGLHRTAPIGALVEVLNEYNKERIIVRIIGRIPDTRINDEIVIKLSSRAFEKVSPNSKRFRAVVSYME